MKTCTLFNSRSGGAQQVFPQVRALAERDRSTLIPLDQYPDRQSLIEVLDKHAPERIIIVGGDGTVSTTIGTLADNRHFPELQFGIIPTGTGNDLARSLDIPLGDVEAAWQLATTGTAREMDLIETSLDEPHWLMNATTAGIGGQVATEVQSETKRTYGALAYWMAALSILSDPPVFRVRLRLDGRKVVDEEVYAFCVANGRYAGGGFAIAPDANLDDGQIHVTVLPALSTVELFGAGLSFVINHEDAAHRIVTYHAQEVEFESSPAVPCSLDGEKGTYDTLKFRVAPRARHMVAGPEAAFGV